jgi:hypothetical protein
MKPIYINTVEARYRVGRCCSAWTLPFAKCGDIIALRRGSLLRVTGRNQVEGEVQIMALSNLEDLYLEEVKDRYNEQTQPGPTRRIVCDLGPAQYPCPVCNDQFHQVDELNEHLADKHPEITSMLVTTAFKAPD